MMLLRGVYLHFGSFAPPQLMARMMYMMSVSTHTMAQIHLAFFMHI